MYILELGPIGRNISRYEHIVYFPQTIQRAAVGTRAQATAETTQYETLSLPVSIIDIQSS